MRSFRNILAAGCAVLALLACGGAKAQNDDLPGRVGRLADVGGRVYIATEQRAEDWLDAQRNDTVTSGDNLWVSGEGRAEIDYGGGQFRLAGDTNVHIARLDDAILGLFVAHGRAIVRVRVLEPGEAARVDTPNTQIALTRPGLYRIEVSPDRTRTEVVVREGEATVSFATGIQQVLPGQSAQATGAEPVAVDVRNGYYIDGFDTWSAERDRRYERSRSATYVSRQMIGHADLDEYGRWENVPEYGALWYPTAVAVDWSPYRYGRWSWVVGWGWSWVDDAPWGYAPFHYGRWVHHRGRWGWAPGGLVARPVWSPAMVAWYGGSGWSFSVSYGAPVYGWVPLAWGEPFIPWWNRCSNRCWTMYNRPYAVHLAERPHAPPTRYVNWSAPGGVTAVAGTTLTARRPVQSQFVDVRPSHVTAAPVLAQAPAVARPMPATISGVRPPAAAPLPAAAYQTKPMRLPATAAPATMPATGGTPPAGSSGQAVARPPARAPATPGMWGPTTQPGTQAAQPLPQGRTTQATQPLPQGRTTQAGPSAPQGRSLQATPAQQGQTSQAAMPAGAPAQGSGATIHREPRPPQSSAPMRAEPRPQSQPAYAPSPRVAPSGAPPQPLPQGSAPMPQQRAVAPSSPAGPAAVPRAAPQAQPQPVPQGQPAPQPPSGRATPQSREGSGRPEQGQGRSQQGEAR